MLTKYEMLFKTDTVCQKADAKKVNAKECKHDLSSNHQHTEKVMKLKKKIKEDPFRKVNMS